MDFAITPAFSSSERKVKSGEATLFKTFEKTLTKSLAHRSFEKSFWQLCRKLITIYSLKLNSIQYQNAIRQKLNDLGRIYEDGRI